VKRKFRVPGQTFSDTIGALISFIEAHPMVKASELPVKFAGIQAPVAPPAAATAPAAEATSVPESAPAGDGTQPPIATSGSIAPFAQGQGSALTAEDQAKLNRLNGDLRWLVTEGYVTEFIDGRLFAAPPMTEARKQEVEKSEHDPENFPEAPHTTSPIPTSDSAASVAEETPASPVVEDAQPAAEEVPKAE
jgi:hypothetical protein